MKKKIGIGIVVMLMMTCVASSVIDAHTRSNTNVDVCLDAHTRSNTNTSSNESFDTMMFLKTLAENNLNKTRKSAEVCVVGVKEEPVENNGNRWITRSPKKKSKPEKSSNETQYIIGDFRGRIYNFGTSITNGFKFHDADHSRISGGGSLDGFFNYYLDEKMLDTYHVLTDTSAWYRNMSWSQSWDKYNCGTGGGINAHTLANGEDPFPLGKPAQGKGMCLDCPDDMINGTWGRGLWRLKNVDWSGKFVIIEGGHHDQNVLWEGENATGMGEDIMQIYAQSLFYNYTLVLMSHLPVGENTNQDPVVTTETNQWRKEFAENHSDMVYVDLVGSVFYKDDGTANESWFYEPDTKEVHMTKAGVKIMGEKVADALFDFMVENNMLNKYIKKL